MARLSSKGASIASLYELDTNLEQVISDLGLANMSEGGKEEVRDKLHQVMGRGYEALLMSQKLNPDSRLQIKNIAAKLESIGHNLQEAEHNLRGSETGLQEAHRIEISLKVREMLAANPEIGSKAHGFLSNFFSQLRTVASACLVAANDLRSIKGDAGQRALNWYTDFTRVLVGIARQNGIRPTVATDRDTGEPQGRFLDIATGFERLLLPSMRSPTKTARAKRLSRALARLRNGPRGKLTKKKQGQIRYRGG
jgi:hypothetical protein